MDKSRKGMVCFFQQLTAACLIGTLTLPLIACSTEGNYAPVTEVNTIESVPAAGVYRVKAGETIYEIAWRYGLDYRYLAERNHLRAPYYMRAGQVIYLRGKASPVAPATPVVAPIKTVRSIAPIVLEGVGPVRWSMPATGRIKSFSSAHKGINIIGQVGNPIYAAATGKVVYSGNGLRGYGNLIIIKHNGLFLSAYAFNKMNFVKEGDWVRRGQKIAEMGVGESGLPMLHFEIRRAGKPIDPAFYLNQS